MACTNKKTAPDHSGAVFVSLFVMARFMRAIHNPLTVWMARTSRAMTVEGLG
jgi:hypothetical protein